MPHPLKGRKKHSWLSLRDGSEANLVCRDCGMQQSPEVGGVRVSSSWFYRRGPGLPWSRSPTVPLCEPRDG